MKKIKYDLCKFTIGHFDNPMHREFDFLKEKGEEGWELVSVVAKKENVYYYFKQEFYSTENLRRILDAMNKIGFSA